MSTGQFWENDPSSPIDLLGEFLGWTDDDPPEAIWGPLNVADFGYEDVPIETPSAPALSVTQPTRTTSTLSWTAAAGDAATKPPVTSWDVQRRSSTDNGSSFGAWAAISGSPFSASTFTASQSGLPTGTPEVVFEYRARGNNGDGPGDWSNPFRIQWQVVVSNPPTAPTNFARGVMVPTSVAFTWSETNDPSVFKHGLFEGGVLRVDNIDPAARSFVWAVTPGSVHTNVGIARANHASDGTTVQWSPVSNLVQFTVPTQGYNYPDPVMGMSNSDEDHGGVAQWPLWRVYRGDDAITLASQAATQRLQLSLQGAPPNPGTAADNMLRDWLENMYFGSGSANRKSVLTRVSVGNENADKGMLSGNPTQADLNAFVELCRRWADIILTETSPGVRRYPNASLWSNPTHFQEFNGIVMRGHGPAARHFARTGGGLFWSGYPPGREQTSDDPTFTMPSMVESSRTQNGPGFLIRMFYRTKACEAQARIDLGNPSARLRIGVGEVGIGKDGDNNIQGWGHRPYYLVHRIWGTCMKLAAQYDLELTDIAYWDQQVTNNTNGDFGQPFPRQGTNSRNILSDEWANANPKTVVVWQNPRAYNHEFGGTHPAQWATYPVSTWKGDPT